MNGSRVTGKYAIPHWKATGFVEYIECGAKQDHMVLVVPEGRHAVRLGTESSIEHQLSVTRGKYYSVTFSAARTCAQSEKLRVSIVPGDVSGGELPVQTVYTSSGWDSYAWAFKAQQGVVSLIIHHGDDQVDDPACGPIVDAVAIRMLNPPHATHRKIHTISFTISTKSHYVTDFLLLYACMTCAENMLINGDFEEGPYMTPGSPWGVLVPPMDEDATSPLPGWAIMSHSKVVKYIDAAHFRVPHGSRAVELVAGVEVALLQEVATVPGRSYRLQFSVGDAGNRCAASPMSVQVATAYGSKRVSYESHGTGGHVRDKLDFKAEGNSTRVVFYSTGYHTASDRSGTLCGPVVDDVSLVSVSHPHARRLLR
uniref:DUF642 domain-containing protein n=1 Tax=Aegilops tauschii subsp. strangulata TaxID=200361 RepID=A0A453CAY2_AEGTS